MLVVRRSALAEPIAREAGPFDERSPIERVGPRNGLIRYN